MCTHQCLSCADQRESLLSAHYSRLSSEQPTMCHCVKMVVVGIVVGYIQYNAGLNYQTVVVV